MTASAGSAAFIVHCLDHARAALRAAGELDMSVTLLSAPGAAAYAGCGYFDAMIRRARVEHPGVAVSAVLDCADQPGLVLGALRQGLTAMRFTGAAETLARLDDIARARGAMVIAAAPPALDLADSAEPERACRDWLMLTAGDDDE